MGGNAEAPTLRVGSRSATLYSVDDAHGAIVSCLRRFRRAGACTRRARAVVPLVRERAALLGRARWSASLRRAGYAERALHRARELARSVGPAAAGPWMWAHRPWMPPEGAVVLAEHGLELAAMFPARIPRPPVHAAPEPGQPTTGVGVHVLAVAQIQQLPLKCVLSLRVGTRFTELTPEDAGDRHIQEQSTRVEPARTPE